MLILLDTGLKEGFHLPNFGIHFRVPDDDEKNKFYRLFQAKKADSFFESNESIKDKFLVIDYGEVDFLENLGKIQDYKKRMEFMNAYRKKQKEVIHKLSFLFASADILEDSTFFQHESNLRIIDIYSLDSRIYHDIISDVALEEFVYKKNFGTSIYSIDIIKDLLIEYDLLYGELRSHYDEKYILYIGEQIFQYINTDSIHIKFSILVSIIEFFINNNKTKDKVTEQFRLKTVLIKDKLNSSYYPKDKDKLKCLDQIYENSLEELKQIYTIRSNITHGNFAGVDVDSKDFKILFLKLKFYTTIVLHGYLENPDYLKFIKNN